MAEKTVLTLDEIESQGAFELPPRETSLVFVVIGNLLSNIDVTIPVRNNNIAVQVCAIVELINVELFTVNTLDCDIQQNQ